MKKIWILGGFLALLQGCQSTQGDRPITREQLEDKTYTYVDLSENKDELWLRARNYLASTYVNSKNINRVSDQEGGTWIGKASIRWKMLDMAFSPYCLSDYQIRFIAKDYKARLQLELLEGTPALSECKAWKLPSGYGYKQIIEEFDDISSGLENALKGKGKLEEMKDF